MAIGRAAGAQPADIDEVLQNSALALLEEFAAGRRIDNPKHWVLRTASNGFRRRFKRGRLWDEFRKQLQAGLRPDDQMRLADQDLGPLMTAFWKLDYDDRQLLVLCEVRGSPDSEVGAALGAAPGTVRQRLSRARVNLAELYMKELLGDRPVAAGCRRPLSFFPRLWAGTITPAQEQELQQHLAACAECRQTEGKLKRHRLEVGVRQLFPLQPGGRQREHRVRLVASIAASAADSRASSGRRPPWRRWSRAAVGVLAVLLLLPLVAVLTLLLRTPKSVGAASACPPGPPPAYAYLDRGELYYRAAPGAPAKQMTSTGGRVDDFWWTPDGADLLYKVATAPPNIAGDVVMIDFVSGRKIWDLGADTQFFTLSPDGHSLAAGSIAVSGGFRNGMQVTVGSFPETAAKPSSSFRTAALGTPIAYRADDYQDRGFLPAAGLGVPPLFWLPAGIYISEGFPSIYSPAGTELGSWNQSAALYDQAMGVPPGAQFTLDAGRIMTRTCAGHTVMVNNALMQAGATWMSVAGDHRTALVTVVEAGPKLDLLEIYADGRATRLSSDGVSALAEVRP